MFNRYGYILGLVLATSASVHGAELDRQAVAEFVAEMVAEYQFDGQQLQRVLGQAKRSERILKAMSRPAEKAQPWFEYRKHFLTPQRITAGIEFWNLNAETLTAATDRYGVPAEIVVAIIGVETAYGQVTGSDRVVDALATLAFHYPDRNAKRMMFFREQLRHLFLMSREQNLDPLSLSGSYAGAMGIPQFMPESYRRFAVDFNNDGQRDIWEDRVDAIGSVANYLQAHGWDRGKSIVIAASAGQDAAKKLLSDSVKPYRSVGEFNRLGVVSGQAHVDELAALFVLAGENSPQYWLALNNFYVIMRYNPRTKYAMAVVRLAEAIRAARNASMS
ncbi:MAG: lytic murein transglycosylase B [Proteobacteria bacterium]|nr:MAG: lytic murein transglycosylase B [Pseudomonadota bacterium]